MRHCIRREHSRVPYYQRSYRLPTPRHENFWQFLSFRTITTQPLSSRTSDPLFQNTLTNASCSGTAPARKKVSPSRHRVKATSAFNLRNPLQNVLGVLSHRRVWSSHQSMANVFPSHRLEGATIPWSHRQWRGSHRPILCQGRCLAQILRTLSITECQSHSYVHGEYRQRFFPNEPKTCSCNNTTIETGEHIIYNCPLYDKILEADRHIPTISSNFLREQS